VGGEGEACQEYGIPAKKAERGGREGRGNMCSIMSKGRGKVRKLNHTNGGEKRRIKTVSLSYMLESGKTGGRAEQKSKGK